MRAKTGDSLISRNVAKELRKSDQELLDIGLRSADPKETNKARWREGPYCWNEKGFLYDEYYYLTEKKDPSTSEYTWDDELLWKFEITKLSSPGTGLIDLISILFDLRIVNTKLLSDIYDADNMAVRTIAKP